MAIIKKSELAKMSATELDAKLFEIRKELNSEKGMAASGGRSQNPGKIREMRRTVARILTIMPKRKEKGTKEAAPASKKAQEEPAKN